MQSIKENAGYYNEVENRLYFGSSNKKKNAVHPKFEFSGKSIQNRPSLCDTKQLFALLMQHNSALVIFIILIDVATSNRTTFCYKR